MCVCVCACGCAACVPADGVFDFYTNAAAIELARNVLLRKSEPQSSLRERAQLACERLVSAVTHSGHGADNVTAVLAMIGDDPAVPFASSAGLWSADS